MIGQRRIHTLVILAALCFCVPAAGYIGGGFFTRYMVDDYCYQARFDDGGFWQTQWDSYFQWAEYSGNRYALTFMYGVNHLLGRSAIRYFPPLVLGLLLAAAVFAFWNLGQCLERKLDWSHLLLGGCALLFFTFYQAPNQYQALYWFSSMMTYTAPLALLMLLAGLILWQALKPWDLVDREKKITESAGSSPSHPEKLAKGLNWIAMALTALLAFFASGFSETNAALQAGALVLALLAAGWGWRREKGLAKRLLPLLLATLLGTLIGMAALVLSPTNAPRQVAYRAPPGLVDLFLISLRFGFDFSWESLKGGPLPIAMTVLTFFFITLSVSNQQSVAQSPKKLAIGLALTGLFIYLLVVCCAAPTVYARTAYPEGRTWITGRFVMVTGAAAIGWLLGQSTGWISSRKMKWSLALIALILCTYSLRSAGAIYTLIPDLQSRADAWDRRDQLIEQARAAGQRELVVPAIDSISLVIELQDDPGYWVNRCAARFYGVDSISAVE